MSTALSAQTNVGGIVDAYFNAIGGIDLVNQVETFYSISEAEINGEKFTVYNKQKKPNSKSVIIHKNDKFISEKVFNGTIGYEVIGKVKKDYTKDEVSKKKYQISVFPEYDYLKRAVFLGEKEVMGRLCNVLGVGEKRIYYDAISGLKLKGSNVKLIEGQRILKEIYYIDYKEIKGIKFPVAVKNVIKGQTIVFYIKSISLNKEVTISDFE